ncbi:DedA family protein [Paramicrobacterium agarici]|uniref:DedA family protein n=1 Tax=Paramicrobacterium agarici TaxID=630514 RepID=UPI00114F45A0|nr:DedA family protein [Microbacterium agarici]TQO21799.1 membrane protein DedA with SNARE-associated domain [Microbacterium agarici]
MISPAALGYGSRMLNAATDTALSGVAAWAVSLMETLGGVGAGVAIALENLFPPLPSEIILPLAGFTASQGNMALVEAIAWTTLGSIVGALLLYGLGALLGRERMIRIADWMPLVKVSEVLSAEKWFAKHGKKAIFFGRMLPIFRSLISIPAGIERMNLLVFGALTAAGSLIWNTAFIMAGFYLGENWHIVEQYADVLKYVVIVAVVVALAAWIVYRVRAARRDRTAGADPSEDSSAA